MDNNFVWQITEFIDYTIGEYIQHRQTRAVNYLFSSEEKALEFKNSYNGEGRIYMPQKIEVL